MAQLLNAFTSELTCDMLASILDDIKPQIISLACQNNLDPDELQQDLAMHALSHFDDVAASWHKQSFLYGMARTLIKRAYSQRHHRSPLDTISMDAPLSSKSGYSLADTLADTYTSSADTSQADYHAHVLHEALHRLPLEEQLYMREVYELNSFDPLPVKWSRKLNCNRSRHAIRNNAYRHLRKDTALASALEVQA